METIKRFFMVRFPHILNEKERRTKQIRSTVELPSELHARVKVHCAKNGITFKEYVLNLLESVTPKY